MARVLAFVLRRFPVNKGSETSYFYCVMKVMHDFCVDA